MVLARPWREKRAALNPGLPADAYSEDDVTATSEAVFEHIYRAYPTVPSPYYASTAA